ncbi:MAG: indolepyruvate ferredoxin oxidoreductase subunit alpha [Clostridia bacterium]|nr:indolepyruvate ferredoxin oxidoreductase subunit alpha [Clostridia bacterium]MBR0422101.1 indolepyruvate ferredoxin oxidoreductase subunit alpha [Clostridia bacterium]
MKKLLLGNAAAARGLFEAGCTFVSSYPGTPSTEITEEAAKFPEVYAEWAPNEKCALEAALGASIAGARAMCAMKHVGLNVAADPLYTAAYTGVNGGLVIAVADDPGMHSSQNEQDSRHHAIASKVPMVEPADSGECRDFMKLAFELSETFDTPVLFRTCTRVAHSQSLVELYDRQEAPLREYVKNPRKYVMAPGNAIPQHVVVENRTEKLRAYGEDCPFNRVEMADTEWGVITSGISYQYVKEALPEVSVLKLGLVNPLPEKIIRDFAAKVKKLAVVEELDPIIETHLRNLGIRVDLGKAELGLLGEFSQNRIRAAFGKALPESQKLEEALPVRPPVLCPGCPHRGLFHVLHKLKVTVSGDIGCYTLGASAPLSAMDSTICMGASIGVLHGFEKVRPEAAGKMVAVIGDSTFMHSGMTGLVNLVYNQGVGVVLILDNSITGMTGHQQNPLTGMTLKEQPTAQLSAEKIAEACGVKRVRVVDPQDLKATEAAIREELAVDEPSVIVVRRPCALLKWVKHKPAFHIDPDKCKSCKACMQIGCPAIVFSGKAAIDPTLCVGCGLCQQLCKFGAISE